MQFKILGPMEIVTGERSSFSVNASKTSQVLALLLVQCPENVGVDTIIAELWGEKPPRSAVTTLQTYIYHARRMLTREMVDGNRNIVVTRPPGYGVQVHPDDIDVNVFVQSVRRGRELLEKGHPQQAVDYLNAGLALWRGPAFAGLVVGEVLGARVAHLDELRIQAVGLRITAERSLGRHLELVPQLRSLVSAHPLNESFHAHLIEVLFESGRRAEALQAYQDLRRILDRELGVEPTIEMQRLQLAVLQGESSSARRYPAVA
ncbi:BTAD domain-containing putative transcriptional regulator [Micromonospora sp. NPDC048898]|uniref:AfsR/SARP family transcriptional regulator n=1 Tax=Micromonospora sp. NPDC048898 TaxID=3364260 RepID=UPI0037185F65